MIRVLRMLRLREREIGLAGVGGEIIEFVIVRCELLLAFIVHAPCGRSCMGRRVRVRALMLLLLL